MRAPPLYRRGSRWNCIRAIGEISRVPRPAREDRYVPVANAVALAEAIPDAKLRVLDNAEHPVFIERFAGISREVITLLKPRKPRKKRL